MLFLVQGDWFRRRRRQRRPTDDVPVQPLLDFVTFWVLIASGAFAIAVAGFMMFAVAKLGFTADRYVVGAIALLTVAGVVCVERSFIFWWRLRDDGHRPS